MEQETETDIRQDNKQGKRERGERYIYTERHINETYTYYREENFAMFRSPFVTMFISSPYSVSISHLFKWTSQLLVKFVTFCWTSSD